MAAEPDEPPPRSKLPLLLGGAVALAGLIVAAAVFLVPEAAPPPTAADVPPSAPSPSPAPRKPAAPVPGPTTPSLPLPPPAPKADRGASDRAFEAAKKESERLAGSGDAVGALAALRACPDPRAEAEAAGFQNRLRAAFNDSLATAKKLADAGKLPEAIALLDARSKATLPEIAAHGAEALGRLRELAARREAWLASEKTVTARKEFREQLGPKLAAALKARRWPEAISLLDTAGSDPRWKDLQPLLGDERSFLALGAAFGDAFAKALQAKLNQETSILLVGGTRLAGKLTALEDGRALVTTAGETAVDVPLDQISADQVLAWTVGKVLPAEDGLTWLKAAIFFFGEGRDDLAALYLATAKEKGAEIDAVELLWREGLTRQALAK